MKVKTLSAIAFVMCGLLFACSQAPDQPPQEQSEKELISTENGEGSSEVEGIVIYRAKGVISMQRDDSDDGVIAQAVAVKGGSVIAVGILKNLQNALPNSVVDDSFSNHYILPGFIDPHIHMLLSSLQYALPLTPPWPMATPDGIVEGLSTRAAFLEQLVKLEGEAAGKKPLIIYGYHDLVHGDLVREDLDAITTERPLIIWHYSSHDFYLNSAALAWAKITPELHERFEGIALNEEGELTGRIFEDALPYLTQTMGPTLLNPVRVKKGLEGFSSLLRQGGVTSVADLGYGIFGLGLEDLNISLNWQSPDHSGYHLYLVPEHRAFATAFGEERVQTILDMVSGARKTPAPVLPQVKFFTDAAFYSQTMRVSPPGYLSGQSQGSQGLWVLEPDTIADTIQPYWDVGLGVRIHSNGDEAQTATLDALEVLRVTDKTRRFVVEHAGLFSPDHIAKAARLDAVISAASHYVFYLGEAYQGPLGEERGNWISPLASLSTAGTPVTLHSDAPLAPPLPLTAASVHLTRATREGGVLGPEEKLSPYEALEAVTVDAAYALGLEGEIGSIAAGMRADFTILEANPLETPGEDWPNIKVWGVVLAGEKLPLKL